jgi:hypothetical protein
MRFLEGEMSMVAATRVRREGGGVAARGGEGESEG